MMKTMRLLLAAATGAALLVGGAHLPVAYAATAGPDFDGPAVADASIPADGDVEVTVTLSLRDPRTVTAVTGHVTPPGGSRRDVAFDLKPSTAARAAIAGRFTVGSDDPPGAWRLNVQVAREGDPARATTFALHVAGRQRVDTAAVSPNPVLLVRGKDVKVSVLAGVTGAETVSARLVSVGSHDTYRLGDLERGSDGRYRGVTYLSDDTAPGEWRLEVSARRGGQTVKGSAAFTVRAPEQGASKKVRARVTLAAPARVAKGGQVKLRGTVHRGTAAYARKRLAVYFKAAGTTTYRLLGHVRANASGRYAVSYPARRDGYFRVKVASTSKTRGALSPQEFVDVRP